MSLVRTLWGSVMSLVRTLGGSVMSLVRTLWGSVMSLVRTSASQLRENLSSNLSCFKAWAVLFTPHRLMGVKCFEQSQGLDITLYKTIVYLLKVGTVIPLALPDAKLDGGMLDLSGAHYAVDPVDPVCISQCAQQQSLFCLSNVNTFMDCPFTNLNS